MADYYPLLARALDAMPDRSPALREAVYQRARSALIGQLRSLDPPLPEADIDLERRALDNAIERLERDHGGNPVPAEVSAPVEIPIQAGAPAPIAVPAPAMMPVEAPIAPAGPHPMDLPEATLPPASPAAASPSPAVPPRPAAEPARAAVEPSEPVIRIQPRKARTPADESPETPAEAVPFVGPDSAGVEAQPVQTAEIPYEPGTLDAAGGRQRPRIDVVAPRDGRSRLVRNVVVGSILLAVIGLIAVAAFLLRDRPSDLQPGLAETQSGTADNAESKYTDRVGGDPASGERGGATQTATQTPGTATPLAQQSDVAVAQRAMLYEESASGANAQPVSTQGRVVWRLENVAGEQGQPLETAVKADIEFAEAGLKLSLTMRRNLDATLPASHTIELAFTVTGTAGERRSVQDIGLLQAKDDESTRGSPVSGLPVRVRENLFLIGLSSLRSDIDRNTDLMLHKNWFDLAVKFTSGQRGIIALEKGTAGTQVLQRAFDQWR